MVQILRKSGANCDDDPGKQDGNQHSKLTLTVFGDEKLLGALLEQQHAEEKMGDGCWEQSNSMQRESWRIACVRRRDMAPSIN